MQRAGITRALASRLSEAPRAPVVMPAGSMPGLPESGSDEPLPAGTAPAPSVGVTGRRPLRGRDICRATPFAAGVKDE